MLRSATIAIALLAVPSVVAAQASSQASDTPAIVAEGEATLKAVPDLAYVQVSAEGRAAKSADAQRQAAAAMTSVQNALKGLGIVAAAIRTTGYQMQPEYDYANGRQIFRDYLARNTIEVRVDDFGRLSDVIDASGASGAASVSGLRFDVKDRAARERDALRQAVQDGMERATAMAAGAGRTLGALLRIQEARIPSAPGPMYRTMAAVGGRGGGEPATPIAPGEVEIRATVTLTVAIK